MNESKSGIGFFGLLTIVFIVLKLCKVIDWSWWWILFPTLFSTIVFIIALIVLVIYSVKKG